MVVNESGGKYFARWNKVSILVHWFQRAALEPVYQDANFAKREYNGGAVCERKPGDEADVARAAARYLGLAGVVGQRVRAGR